jgi:hypothetical protein
MRRTVAVIGAVIGLAFAAGCTHSTQRVDGEAGPVGTRTSQPAPAGTTAPSSAAPHASTATSPSGAASPSGGAAGASPPRKVTRSFFKTPSKNIACIVQKKGVRCDIDEKSWTPPPKPAWCPDTWGDGLLLGKTKKIDFTCKSDASLTIADVETLEYGQAVQAGDYLCRSEQTGMRCENTDTGYGFTLSAAKYTTF